MNALRIIVRMLIALAVLLCMLPTLAREADRDQEARAKD